MSGPDGLFADGRGLSDLMQGVTLEVFGEGESMGPLNDEMRAEALSQQSDKALTPLPIYPCPAHMMAILVLGTEVEQRSDRGMKGTVAVATLNVVPWSVLTYT